MSARRRRKQLKDNSWFQARYHRSESTRSMTSRSSNKLVRRFMVLIIFVLLLGLTGVTAYFTRIDSVSVDGIDDNLELVGAIENSIATNYKFMWQLYTRPVGEINTLPSEVKRLELMAKWTSRTVIVLAEEYPPVLRWETAGNRYLLDERGMTLRPATDKDSMPLVRDSSNLPVQAGERAVPREFVVFTLKVLDSPLDITELRVIDTTSELYAELEAGYYIRFNTNESASSQLENVARVQELAAQNNNSTINDYIDVRIPYKAYYR